MSSVSNYVKQEFRLLIEPTDNYFQIVDALIKSNNQLSIQSKEIQHGLPTGALSSGDIETGIRTAASLEFLKDLQSTAKLSTSDITKQAIQGDFYDQLKDALKLLVKKG